MSSTTCCGEGIVTERIAERLRPGTRVIGLDRDVPTLRREWESRGTLEFVTGDAHALPFDDDAFDAASMIETLQLVVEPPRVLAEAVRVARRAVLVSVPQEPLWRALNLARGAYVRDFGNTPGHVHHWSCRTFSELLSSHGDLVALRVCRPWVLALVRPL